MKWLVTEKGTLPLPTELDVLLSAPIAEFAEFTVRCVNALKGEGILTIYDVVRKTEDEILNIQNFGIKSVEEIRQFLNEHNLHFGMKFIDDTEKPLTGYRVKLPKALSGLLEMPIKDHPLVSSEVAEILRANNIHRLGELYVRSQENTLRMNVNMQAISALHKFVQEFGLMQNAPIQRERGGVWYLAVPAQDVTPLP
jgi:hypothetical protein